MPDETTQLRKDLDKLHEEYIFNFNSLKLFGHDLIEIEIRKKIKIEEGINNLSKQIDTLIKNPIYDNSFEWRFEFPEVLNDDGIFVGFDVIIGNPPYILVQNLNDKSLFNSSGHLNPTDF